MRNQAIAFSLICAVLLSAPAVAGPPELPMDPTSVSPGPFAGVVLPGETNVERYQNAPSGATCVALAQPYLVTVATSGPLTVTVGHLTRVVDGVGSFSIERGVCTVFHISLQNNGESPAGYAVDVMGGPLGGLALSNFVQLT